MSHNKITVQDLKPDLNGNITLDLNDLNVSTLNNGMPLKYDGANWGALPIPITNKTLYFRWNKNVDDDYGDDGNYSNNDYYIYIQNPFFSIFNYKDSSISFNNATSANSPKENANYAESLTMATAGTYLFIASVSIGYYPSVVGTERMDIQWSDGTAFGNKATVNASYQQPAICWGIKTISANAIVRLVCTNINSNPGIVEAEQATALSIAIYKI